VISGGLLEAPLYPLKPGVSRGHPLFQGGPGPLRPPRNSTTVDHAAKIKERRNDGKMALSLESDPIKQRNNKINLNLKFIP